MNRTKKIIKKTMKRLGARREIFIRTDSSIIVGDCWILPLNNDTVHKALKLLKNPFPVTSKSVIIPVQKAKEFTKLCRSLQDCKHAYAREFCNDTDRIS